MPATQTKSRARKVAAPANTKLDRWFPENVDFRWVIEATLEAVIAWEYFREADPELALPPARQLPKSHWASMGRKPTGRALHIIPDDGLVPPDVRDVMLPQHAYVMGINFLAGGVNELIEEFAGWARKEHKRKVGDIRKHGQGAAPPWHRLKQLAAKRLDDQGLTFEKAQRLIEKRRTEEKCEGASDVLPRYANSGGWHDAITAARRFLEGDPNAPRLLDHLGRRRWWELCGNAARLAASLLKLRRAILLPKPTSKSPGSVARQLQLAQWLTTKSLRSRDDTRQKNTSIGE